MTGLKTWIENHIDDIVRQFDIEDYCLRYDLEKSTGSDRKYLEKELIKLLKEHEKVIEEESKKLDKLCEILCTTTKSIKEAEKEIYDVNPNFYPKPKFYIKKPRKKPKKKQNRKPKTDQRSKQSALENFYLEKDLTFQKRESLIAQDYKRLKISPFGDSGSAYYWIKTRYNESKEHAFFCYLIESELKRKGIKNIVLNINSGPDLVFEHKEKTYCFDVETGKNLKKHPEFLESKFSKYKKKYDVSFVFITRKAMKYKYAKFGEIVTRSTLKKVIQDL